jgi:hypothetical protein
MLRLLFVIMIAAALFSNCNSGSGKTTLCDTTCLKDTIKFIGNHPLKPYVYIIPKNCKADSLVWSYSGAGTDRKMSFGEPPIVNKDFVRVDFKDTSYAWVQFNDCSTRQGFLLKLYFDKKKGGSFLTNAINGLDPKFSVADGLVAYTDRGNIFVEDALTGQQAMMTFGKKADIDFSQIHQTLDTVHITRDRIWSKVKIDNAWQEIEKAITLK